jgi:hypothetical protein
MCFEMTAPATHVIPFPTSQVNIYLQQQLISSSLNQRLHALFTLNIYWQYLEAKHNWGTRSTHKHMVWYTYHKTLHQQPAQQHRQLMKYMNGWLPTGHYVHHHDKTEEHRCPHCRTVRKKDLHLLRCLHPERATKRQHFLTVNLTNIYHHSNTAQPQREHTSQNLIQWFRNHS